MTPAEGGLAEKDRELLERLAEQGLSPEQLERTARSIVEKRRQGPPAAGGKGWSRAGNDAILARVAARPAQPATVARVAGGVLDELQARNGGPERDPADDHAGEAVAVAVVHRDVAEPEPVLRYDPAAPDWHPERDPADDRESVTVANAKNAAARAAEPAVPEPEPWEPPAGGDPPPGDEETCPALLRRRGPEFRILRGATIQAAYMTRPHADEFSAIPAALALVMQRLAIRKQGVAVAILLELAAHCSRKRNRWAVWMTDDELAARIGTTRESVCKAWGLLRGFGIVREATEVDHMALASAYRGARLDKIPSRCFVLQSLDRWTLGEELTFDICSERNRRTELRETREQKRGTKRGRNRGV